MRTLFCSLLVASLVWAAPTSEGSRTGSAFFVGRAGTAWTYQVGEKGRARIVIDRVENWSSHFHIEWGKQSTSGAWRVKDGAWVEKLAGRPEEVVLPAALTVGSRWNGLPSVERGGSSATHYEVISLDTTIELPNGQQLPGCVAVLETGETADRPMTHFYAPNIGKVAVQGGDGWLLRLQEMKSASRSHGGE